jgi:hypothetical protein
MVECSYHKALCRLCADSSGPIFVILPIGWNPLTRPFVLVPHLIQIFWDKKVLGVRKKEQDAGERPTSLGKICKWLGERVGAKDPQRRGSLLGQKEEMAEGQMQVQARISRFRFVFSGELELNHFRFVSRTKAL